jgi:hypothetical protein
MEELSQETASAPISFQVVSRTPGRLRLRICRQYRESEKMAEIASILPAFFPQIEEIRSNAQTGSLTVYYAPEAIALEEVLPQLQNFGVVLEDAPKALPETSQAAANLTGVLAALNQRVKQVTAGEVDLRFLVPLFFGLLALRQAFLKSPRLKTAPWYVLAWYAFDSFLKLNRPPTKPAPKKQLPPTQPEGDKSC